MFKRELKSTLLKLHLNVGTSWNILSSTHLRLRYHQAKIRIGDLTEWADEKKIHLQDWMEAWRKCLIHLNDPMNWLGMITIPLLAIQIPSDSLRPAHSSHTSYSPHLPAGSLGSWPTLILTAISWDKVSKRNKCQVSLSFIPAGKKNKSLKKKKKDTEPFPSLEEHSNKFSKINLLSTGAPQRKVQQNHIIPWT